MFETIVDIDTPEGPMDTYIAHPEDGKPHPLIIFCMDGLGVRPVLREMAARFAAQGYYVALPNLFHRGGRADALDLANNHERMYALVAGLAADRVAADIGALLAYADGDAAAHATRVGCVGYCLGGRCSLTAAGRFPERVVAAACIHGAQLAVDHPDSPHRLAPQLRARIYVAVAEQDPWLAPDEMATLRQAFETAGVNCEMELYAGVAHGFAVPGLEVYDKAAAERHWGKVLDLFAQTL